MASEVEITAPVSSFRDRLGPRGVQPFTHYPQAQTFVVSDYNKKEGNDSGGDILPFMARTHSPVRVKFTPGTLNKRKSRVSETAKTAIFNYRPAKRKDNLTTLRFRAPDATLTTNLQYLSPWISVTKTDYKDPRCTDSESSEECSSLKPATQGLFPRSVTESVIELSPKESPILSRAESPIRSEIVSRDRSRATSSKTISTEKRVTIVEPAEMADISRLNSKLSTPNKCNKVMDGINEPEGGFNYYSGYLPPEYSEKIAEKLNIGDKSETPKQDSDEKPYRTSLNSQYYKPLVGDRTTYKRGTYPMQPKLLMSDIYQIRLEDRKRLSNAFGQAPVHFSALKDRGTLAMPRQKGVVLDEAVRVQQRVSSANPNPSNKPSRVPKKVTSLDQFQLQRERTYHLQNLAREMINK